MKTPHLLSNSFRLVYRDTGMKALALIGIVMILLANIVMYAIVQQIHFIEISVMMLLSYVGILLLVKSGRSQLAITIYMLSGLLAIMRFGQFSYESFLIVTTALLAHVMTVFVLQTRKRWMLTMVIALVSIVTVGSWHALEAPTSEIREYRTLMTITQTITFLAGAAVVRVIYMLFINLNDRTENAIEALREQKVLLEQRSAEFEAANLALVQSESRYRTLVEGASEAILLVDFPSWRVLDGNVSAEKLFKISRDEMLKATITDFVMGPTTQLGKDVAAEDFIDAFVQGEALTFEQVHADSAGREFLCQVRLMMLPGEPNRARATVVDISEQRASEIQIRELAERLQLVSDNVPVRIAYFDATLNLQFWNRSFGHTFGLSDDKPPLHAKAAFGEALFNDYTAYLATALAGEQVEFESHGAGSDDDTSVAKVIFKPHVVNHKVIGIFAVALDISAERKAQRTLSKTSNLLQAVTDNMPARLIYVDHKNKIRFLNRRYEEFGVDISAALGQSPDEALPASMRTITGNLAEGLSVDERIKKERTIVLPSGEERIENIVVMPHIVDAIPQGYIVLVSDVTELRRAEAAFQQAQKTESLGVLAGGIAHDFNNLLVAILGQSAIASAKLSHEHPAKRHLDKAIQASERAALLTNQMLAYSGRGAFSVESLNLNKLIEDNLALFRVSVPPTSKFNIDLCDSLPLVDADPAQMQQVIMNLIINAGQAIDSNKGYIEVKTSHVQLDSESVTKIALVDGDLTTGAYVVVAVSDNGVGMDSATLDRVFDPFFTTKPGGSGLGLAAVLGIMRGHSGGIGLHTVKGEGTRFTLYFPASHKAIAGNLMSAESSPTATTSISKNCNILVIDDEPTVLELAADVLEMAGMHSVTIDEPLAGIRYFEIHSDKIDLVMLDLSMPKMSGLEVFEALQALDPTVRVLLTSGYSREDVIGRFSENRVAGFIQKPYNVDQLINSVHKALNRELA